MRLWHYKLIPFLPKSQLIAQWRELNSIFAKQDRHILINYVYEYDKSALYLYSCQVCAEMKRRGIRYNNYKAHNYFYDWGVSQPMESVMKSEEDMKENPFPLHHNFAYLRQCFYNLEEKHDRGQKDFTDEEFKALENFYQTELEHELGIFDL